MSELKAKERNRLNDKVFGIPSLRKYPLNDEEHVRKAIQMFHHCPIEHKRELAKNIYKISSKYNIEIDKSSPVYEYLSEDIKNDMNYIFMNKMWDTMLEEVIILKESTAKQNANAEMIVDKSIKMWKMQKKLITNNTIKNQLAVKIKNELNIIESYMHSSSYDAIVRRAEQASKKIERGDSFGIGGNNKLTQSRVSLRTNNNASFGLVKKAGGTILKTAATGLAAGAAVAAGNRIAGGSKTGSAVKGLGAAAIGTAAGAIYHTGKAYFQTKNNLDPNSMMKQIAEKYYNFLQSYYEEIKSYNPFERGEG